MTALTPTERRLLEHLLEQDGEVPAAELARGAQLALPWLAAKRLAARGLPITCTAALPGVVMFSGDHGAQPGEVFSIAPGGREAILAALGRDADTPGQLVGVGR